jgi:NADH dehydrogenase
MMQNAQVHQVVIIGGGFGGLYAAKALRRAPVRVTLVDKRNFHLFQPLLYQVATGGVSPGDIAYPLRLVFAREAHFSVIMAEVSDIDLSQRTVILIGFDNKLLVLFQWAWNYITRKRGAQLITGTDAIH